MSLSNIKDTHSNLTKWKRINEALIYNQNKSPNWILKFINESMNPAKYINNHSLYNDRLFKLNTILSLVWVELGRDNKRRKTSKSSSVDDLKKKAKILYHKLQEMNVHENILLLCKPELLADNYFHAVFEWVKTIANKVRNKTRLVDVAFSSNWPYLLINRYITDTEKSEHKWFSNLLKWIFWVFRNTAAHELKHERIITEQDALDIFPTLSYIHRRLDNSRVIRN